MNRVLLIRSLSALLLLVTLSACGGSEAPATTEAAAAAEYAKGPHNGRLLKDGDFALEMTIFEDGVPPQFRVYPTRDGKPIAASSVNLSVTLKRLDGEINRFAFTPDGDFLSGHRQCHQLRWMIASCAARGQPIPSILSPSCAANMAARLLSSG